MKLKIMLVALLLLVSACSKSTNVVEEQNLARYKAYYALIFDNDRFIREPQHFDLDVVFSEIEGQYRYDIIVDNPRIAMYDVEIMVVEDDLGFQATRRMMPSFGIFESNKNNMIPNQVDSENGYVKGMIVSGMLDKKVVELKIMVGWRDYSKLNSHREFFIRNLDYDKMKDPDFNIIGGDEEGEQPPLETEDPEDNDDA